MFQQREGDVKRTTVLASLCRSREDEELLREIIAQELGPEVEMIDLLVSRSKEEYAKFLDKAEVLFAYRLPKDYSTFIERANKLNWLHLAAAGVDGSLYDDLKTRSFVISNSRGMHANRCAEYVIGSIIAYTKGFMKAWKLQGEKRWARAELIQENKTLAGKTLGILGLGAVGKAVAKVAHPFGLEILGLRRHPEEHPKPLEISHVFGPQNLREFIHPLDYLVLAVPLTKETHRLIDREEFVRLKTTALIVNISRGAILEEAALIQSLEDGEIGGAVLDVFEEEPLSQKSPLWSMENVFITPHVAGTYPHYLRDAARIFARNLRHYLEKRPLENLIDKDLGY